MKIFYRIKLRLILILGIMIFYVTVGYSQMAWEIKTTSDVDSSNFPEMKVNVMVREGHLAKLGLEKNDFKLEEKYHREGKEEKFKHPNKVEPFIGNTELAFFIIPHVDSNSASNSTDTIDEVNKELNAIISSEQANDQSDSIETKNLSTELNQAIQDILKIETPNKHKAILIFSNQEPDSDKELVTYSSITLAQENKAVIYTVFFTENNDGLIINNSKANDEDPLVGRSSKAKAKEIITRVFEELKTEYRLTYQSDLYQIPKEKPVLEIKVENNGNEVDTDIEINLPRDKRSNYNYLLLVGLAIFVMLILGIQGAVTYKLLKYIGAFSK